MSADAFDTLTDVIGIPLVVAAIIVLIAAEMAAIDHRPTGVKVGAQVLLAVVAVAWIGMRFAYFV